MVLSETADPLALLVGMMFLSAVAQKAGFFDWSASLAVRAGGGRVRRLFVLVFVVGTPDPACKRPRALVLPTVVRDMSPGTVAAMESEPRPVLSEGRRTRVLRPRVNRP